MIIDPSIYKKIPIPSEKRDDTLSPEQQKLVKDFCKKLNSQREKENKNPHE